MENEKKTRARFCWACGEPFSIGAPRTDRTFRRDGTLRGFVAHPECADALAGVAPDDLARTPGAYPRGNAVNVADDLPW